MKNQYRIGKPGEYLNHNDWTVNYYVYNEKGQTTGFRSLQFDSLSATKEWIKRQG